MLSHNEKQEQERVTPLIPANWVPGPRQGGWTYEMYAALPEDGNRYEVVQEVLIMLPAPEMSHQAVIQRIRHYLDERIFAPRLGLVFTGPVDGVLSARSIVQPDVLVVLKKYVKRVQPKRIAGIPDLVVEAISPGSATYDRLVKHSIYEKAEVPEYWLVHANEQTIDVFVMEEDYYHSLGEFLGERILQSRIVPGITVPAAQFFDWTGGLRYIYRLKSKEKTLHGKRHWSTHAPIAVREVAGVCANTTAVCEIPPTAGTAVRGCATAENPWVGDPQPRRPAVS